MRWLARAAARRAALLSRRRGATNEIIDNILLHADLIQISRECESVGSREPARWLRNRIAAMLPDLGDQTHRLGEVGLIGAAYIVLRLKARFAGCWLGGRMARSAAGTCRWIGLALLPQAGVTIGMALVAEDHFPEIRDTVITVAFGSTVRFERFGPLFTRWAVARADAPAKI